MKINGNTINANCLIGDAPHVVQSTWDEKAAGTFFFWMYNRYYGADTPKGMLAEDMAFDARTHRLPAFDMTAAEWLDRVYGDVRACNETRELMRQCVDQYEKTGGALCRDGATLEQARASITPRDFWSCI